MNGRKGEPHDQEGEASAKTEPTVLAQIVALENMPFDDLKGRYKALIGKEPPSRSRKHIFARLAYRIQEIAFGGLSPEARSRLEAIGEAHMAPGRKVKGKERKGAPAVGTKLIREYMGTEHEVTVLEKGFQYRDGVYRSLSAIAKEISGTHTSGPVFFGLKKKGDGK